MKKFILVLFAMVATTIVVEAQLHHTAMEQILTQQE